LSARDLFRLQDWLRDAAEQLYTLGHDYDDRLTVTSVIRSFAEQTRLYNRFLAGESGGIPAARPGTSMHELGRAFDMARPGQNPFSDDLLPQLGAVWNSWGGSWHPSDPVHFEA
jgi:LAS superfamily LD-carboxypeptidase LdcB